MIDAIAKAMHAAAFDALVDDCRMHPPTVLQGRSPGPGGDWYGTVPETPPAAYAAAEALWAKASSEWRQWVEEHGERAAQDEALACLGCGIGDPDCRLLGPDVRFYYYVVADVVYAHPGNAAVWVIKEHGVYPCEENR